MTLVCAWLDDSYGRCRLTAIADGRIADKDGVTWKPRSDTTTKLFRVPVRCFVLDSFSPEVATWVDPYYETELGIGYAGYCVEAYAIIALFTRSLERLITERAGEPRPEPDKIVELCKYIASQYFKEHRNLEAQHVNFVLMGFSPIDGVPWIGTVSHAPSAGATSQLFHPVQPRDPVSIGDIAAGKKYRQRIYDLLQRIEKHSSALKTGSGEDAAFELQREQARLKNAAKKAIELVALEHIGDQFEVSVGGVMQKMELRLCDEQAALVSFSIDDHPDILDWVPSVSGDGRLGYVRINEMMGHKKRPRS